MIQMNCVYRGIIRRDSFWDWLVFKKVQDSLGGRVRLIISGSAPISKEVSYHKSCAKLKIVVSVTGHFLSK